LLKAAKAYVRIVDAINRRVGRIAMYLLFGMMGVLLWSSISKTFFFPSLWTLEMAQFAMVAYYIMGGPYSIQLGSNVRMDLFYGSWSDKKKAQIDAITILFLLFYLGVLLVGGVSSTAYSLGHYGGEPFVFFGDLVYGFVTGGISGVDEVIGRLERNPTAWRPVIWPIKSIMVLGIFLMLLQAISELFKDLARIHGAENHDGAI
jgi:TRAP-type mannitol/chloroaromatic compound transport system permease small subunit